MNSLCLNLNLCLGHKAICGWSEPCCTGCLFRLSFEDEENNNGDGMIYWRNQRVLSWWHSTVETNGDSEKKKAWLAVKHAETNLG